MKYTECVRDEHIEQQWKYWRLKLIVVHTSLYADDIVLVQDSTYKLKEATVIGGKSPLDTTEYQEE